MYPVPVETYENEILEGLEELGFRFKPFKAIKRALRFRRKKGKPLNRHTSHRPKKIFHRKISILPVARSRVSAVSCNLSKYREILAQMKKIYDNNQKILHRNQLILNENKKIYQENQKIVNEFKNLLKQYGLL